MSHDVEAMKKEIAENEAEMVRLNNNLLKGLNPEGNPIDWGDIARAKEDIEHLGMVNDHLKHMIEEASFASPVEDVDDYGMPKNIDLNDVPWRW